MRDFIYNLLEPLIKEFGHFRAGFITALIVILFLLILCWIYKVFSKKRVKEIILPGEKGSLVISASAVSDLVNTVVANKIKCISIKKIILWRGQNGIAMEIQGTYDIDGGRLPEVAEEMRKAILKNLDGQLGITTVKEVVPNIKKITSQNLNPSKFK